MDGVRGLNWNGVTTHAHFQSFLPFRIFVQSSCNPVSLSCHRRRPTGGLLSPTLNSFPGNVWFCACTAVLIPLHSGSESVAPIRCGQALICILLLPHCPSAGRSMDQAAGGRQGWWPINGCLPLQWLHGFPTVPDDGESVHSLA